MTSKPKTKLLPARTLLLVAFLVLALFGGGFHHHASGSDCTACVACRGAVQMPAAALSGVLTAASLAPVGFLNPDAGRLLPRLGQFAPLPPRAPPALIPLDTFREGGAAGA